MHEVLSNYILELAATGGEAASTAFKGLSEGAS